MTLATTASLWAVSRAILWRGQLPAAVAQREGQPSGAVCGQSALRRRIECADAAAIRYTYIRSLSSRPALNSASASSASAVVGRAKKATGHGSRGSRVKNGGCSSQDSSSASHPRNRQTAVPIMAFFSPGDESRRPSSPRRVSHSSQCLKIIVLENIVGLRQNIHFFFFDSFLAPAWVVAAGARDKRKGQTWQRKQRGRRERRAATVRRVIGALYCA